MRGLFLALLLAMAGVSTTFGQNVAVSKLALMTFEGKMDVNVAPSQVWTALTTGSQIPQWNPLWKTGLPASLTTVGQAVPFVDSWGNRGTSVVLFVDRGKELRVAHMPQDGSFVCQVKFRLEPKGGGTMVTVTEQYSDVLDVPLDRDTAATVKQEVTQYMAALKRVAEKPAGTP